METTLVKNITYTYNMNDLDKKICDTIDKIKMVVKHYDYQIIGKDIDFTKPKGYSHLDNYQVIEYVNLTKRQMKKIQRYCYWINKNPSLKKINAFLCLLSRLLKLEKVHVKPSLKEQAIQEARKKMKVAKENYENLLKAYKDEKGDFYKIK